MRDQRHAHEIGQARCLHLGHEARTIILDGSRTDAEIIGNLLVGMARHQPLQHIALAVRQGGEAALNRAALGLTFLVAMVPVERRLHRREQNLVLEGLFQEIDGTDLHRFQRERHVVVSCDHDHRYGDLELAQAPQQIDAADLGHFHIRYDAPGLDGWGNLEEDSCGFVGPHVDPCRAQLEGERLAHCLVVVDHMHCCLVSRHR